MYIKMTDPLVNHYLIILITCLLKSTVVRRKWMLIALGRWQTEEQKCLPVIWCNLMYSSPLVLHSQFTIIINFIPKFQLFACFLFPKHKVISFMAIFLEIRLHKIELNIYQQNFIKRTHSCFYISTETRKKFSKISSHFRTKSF